MSTFSELCMDHLLGFELGPGLWVPLVACVFWSCLTPAGCATGGGGGGGNMLGGFRCFSGCFHHYLSHWHAGCQWLEPLRGDAVVVLWHTAGLCVALVIHWACFAEQHVCWLCLRWCFWCCSCRKHSVIWFDMPRICQRCSVPAHQSSILFPSVPREASKDDKSMMREYDIGAQCKLWPNI